MKNEEPRRSQRPQRRHFYFALFAFFAVKANRRFSLVSVSQQHLDVPKKGEVPVPLFYVEWRTNRINDAIDVMISGLTGELLNLRQEDDSYSKRPTSLIKDMDKLLAIPDEEFLKYSPLEKSNLVVRFAAIHYPVEDITNGASSPSETNALSHERPGKLVQ